MTILDQPTIMIGLGGKIQMVYHFIQFTFSGLLVGDVGGINLAPCKILIEAQMGSWCKALQAPFFGHAFPFFYLQFHPLRIIIMK
jgi:hypothetical protein